MIKLKYLTLDQIRSMLLTVDIDRSQGGYLSYDFNNPNDWAWAKQLSHLGRSDFYHMTAVFNRLDELENKMNIDTIATQTPEEKEALDRIKGVELNSDGVAEAFDLIDTTPHQYEMSKLKSNPVIQLSIDEIDKFSGNEWNGEGLPPVGCEVEAKSGSLRDWFKGEVVAHDGEFAVLRMHEDYPFNAVYAGFGESRLRKPESPEAKEKRERLEAAYDLYCEWVGSDAMTKAAIKFDDWKIEPDFYKKWLRIVDKTNYRKGE